MRTRLYWLLPDLQSARVTMDDLLAAGIDAGSIHFLAPEGTDMRGLHAANVLQTSDVIRAGERGLVTGAVVGSLLGAIVAVYYPIVGDDPQWSLAPVLAVAGALFGTWTSTMIGISEPSTRLQRFQAPIAQGWILLMVDLPVWRVAPIEERLRALHPEARLEGRERALPAFP